MKEKNRIDMEIQKQKWAQRGANLASLAVLTSSLYSFPFPQSLISILPISFCLLPLKKQIDKHYDIETFIGKQKDILEMEQLYQTYLNSISLLLKQYDFTSSYDVAYLFQDALYQGLFSKDLTFQVESCKVSHEIPRLYGERVFSGKAECRHIATLFDDFSQNFPIETGYLSTYFCYPYELHPIKMHAVNVITVHGKKMVKDFTNQKDYLFVSNQLLKSVQSGENLVLQDQEEQNEKVRKILGLPSLEDMEYQNLPKRKIDKEMLEDFYILHQSARENLKKICQIEESYTKPQQKKEKVFIKE